MKIRYLVLLFCLIFSNQTFFAMQNKYNKKHKISKNLKYNISNKNLDNFYTALIQDNEKRINKLAAKFPNPHKIEHSDLLGCCFLAYSDVLTPKMVKHFKRLGANLNMKNSKGYNILDILVTEGVNLSPLRASLGDMNDADLIKRLIESLRDSDVAYKCLNGPNEALMELIDQVYLEKLHVSNQIGCKYVAYGLIILISYIVISSYYLQA